MAKSKQQLISETSAALLGTQDAQIMEETGKSFFRQVVKLDPDQQIEVFAGVRDQISEAVGGFFDKGIFGKEKRDRFNEIVGNFARGIGYGMLEEGLSVPEIKEFTARLAETMSFHSDVLGKKNEQGMSP